ncbi:MAG: ATP-binding protein [Candidatus Eisenbacteria bacterium]
MGKPTEIAVISGKGGAGKTVLAASLAKSTPGSVVADCDVDTPNMHLLLKPNLMSEHAFFGEKTAVMDGELCTRCGDCFRTCRFGAIREIDIPAGWSYSVDALSCEGCGVCTMVCPEDAILMKDARAGAWCVSSWDLGPFVHAHLTSARKNTETLVRILRREASKIAGREGRRHIIIDGPAGIGATVVAAVEGVSLAVVVTEPTVSGINDLRRLIRLVQQIGIRTAAVINKYDLNTEVTLAIEEYLSINGVPLLGKICFSTELNRAVGAGEVVVNAGDDSATQALRGISNRILGLAAREVQT